MLQLRWAHWQRWQGGRFLAKNLLPKRLWWIHQDRAVLQQLASTPQLGAADPLAPWCMHQVSGCAEGEAVAPLHRGSLNAKEQR
jgi:hypothetical protein